MPIGVCGIPVHCDIQSLVSDIVIKLGKSPEREGNHPSQTQVNWMRLNVSVEMLERVREIIKYMPHLICLETAIAAHLSLKCYWLLPGSLTFCRQTLLVLFLCECLNR